MLTLNILPKEVDQSWSLLRIVKEAPPSTWEKVFQDAIAELETISEILDEEEQEYGSYYPLKADIFKAFHCTKLPNVKVVIVGQDPYPQTISYRGKSMPRATGLCFSVRQEDLPLPPSLKNIYAELARSIYGFKIPDHGDLGEWAQQGVFLLNSCLTLRPGKPGSHGIFWHQFIKKVFSAIAEINPNCIFFLWGNEAQALKPIIGEKSLVLECPHPRNLKGFLGCDHFIKANNALKKAGKNGIDWKISSLAELRSRSYFSQSDPTKIITSPTPLSDSNNKISYSPPNIFPSSHIILADTKSSPIDHSSNHKNISTPLSLPFKIPEPSPVYPTILEDLPKIPNFSSSNTKSKIELPSIIY